MALPESRFVASFDGAPIAYRSYGSGQPTVLLSNGIGCNQAYVDHAIRALAAQTRVVIWDYRGHLDSAAVDDPRALTVETCLRDMHAVTAALGDGPLVLAGFSMGVQLSLEYLHRHPRRVHGLIALLGTYEYPLRSFFHMGRAGEAIVPGTLAAARRWPRAARRVWRSVLGGGWVFPLAKLLVLNPAAAGRDDFESWRRHLAGVDPLVFLQLGVYLSAHSAAHGLERLAGLPCLVVAGDRDNFTPLAVCRKLHQRAPGSEWFVIPGGSHGGLFEFPDVVGPRLQAFWREHF